MDPLDPAVATGVPSEENPNKIDNVDLAYLFKKNRDHFPAKPYYDDGNPEMYTKENRAKRAGLKTNVVVKTAIENFQREQFERTSGKNPVVSKEEYFKVFVKIGMILRPGIDADDLTKLLKEDFENDSMEKTEGEEPSAEQAQTKQPDFLTESKLYDALFEMVDLWCQNIDEYEY
jgi:hypothetical protein